MVARGERVRPGLGDVGCENDVPDLADNRELDNEFWYWERVVGLTDRPQCRQYSVGGMMQHWTSMGSL